MRKFLILLAVLTTNSYLSAQETHFEVVSEEDSTYRHLHENAPHLENVADVPRFTLIGKDRRFYMGLGASINATAGFDFGHPISDPNYFVTSRIPMTIAPGNGGQFKFSAQQSRIYLNILAFPGNENQFGAYAAINFLGENYAPKLHHAYLRYRGLTAGYTYTMFADVSCVPPTIDYEGPNGLPTIIHAMVSYEGKFGPKKEWGYGIALDNPEASYTDAARTATVSQRVPDVPFYLQRSWADGRGWLRASGIVRNILYRDLVSEKNVDRVGWGVKLSGKSPVYGPLSAYYMGLYGKGIASYIQDLNGAAMDLAPSRENPGRLEAVEAWSGMIGLQYQFSPKVFSTTTYSHVRAYGDTGVYRYAQYFVANIFYDINSVVQAGAEYLYGRRVAFDGAQAHDNRLQVMLKLSF